MDHFGDDSELCFTAQACNLTHFRSLKTALTRLAWWLACAANGLCDEWLQLAATFKSLTGRAAPCLHPKILQSFGISVKLFQFAKSIHVVRQKRNTPIQTKPNSRFRHY